MTKFQNSRLVCYLKYTILFSIGVGCGMWVSSSKMRSGSDGPLALQMARSQQDLLSLPTHAMAYDAMGERSVDAAKNTHELVRILNHLHRGEVDTAKQRAEELLDHETLIAYYAAASSKDLDAIDRSGIELFVAKCYRQHYPSTTRFKADLRRVFNDLPADAFMDTDEAAAFDPLAARRKFSMSYRKKSAPSPKK